MSADRAGQPRKPLQLRADERAILDYLRAGAKAGDVLELLGIRRSTLEGRLGAARRRNGCATRLQLAYEYGRSLPDERSAPTRAAVSRRAAAEAAGEAA